MATYTAPTTRASGYLVTAANWNTDIVENIKYLKDAPTFDGAVTVSSTTDASSSTTGGLIVSGGVGVAKKLYVGTNLAVGSTPATTGTVRVPSAFSAYFRNAANSADIRVLAADASNNILIGSSTTPVYIDTTGTTYVGGDLSVAATKKLYIDGGGDTYVYEDTANRTWFVNGGTNSFWINATTAEFTGDVRVNPTKKLYLDGGGDTYIEEYAANAVKITCGGTGVFYLAAGAVETTAVFNPGNDNAVSCGVSGKRWTAVYAVNGTIQTSDRTKKRDIAPATLGAEFVQRLQPVEFTMNDEDVRRHGLIAQDVIEAAQGVSLTGIVTGDHDGGYGLNYAGFVPALIAAIQQQQQDIDALKARVQ